MATVIDRRRSPWPPPLGPREISQHPATHTHSLTTTMRVLLVGLVVAIVALGVAVGVVTAWVVTLRDQRLHAQAQQQQMIDSTFCQVLAQLPANSAELNIIRRQRHCAEPGLSPDQMRALAQTGGTP